MKAAITREHIVSDLWLALLQEQFWKEDYFSGRL